MLPKVERLDEVCESIRLLCGPRIKHRLELVKPLGIREIISVIADNVGIAIRSTAEAIECAEGTAANVNIGWVKIIAKVARDEVSPRAESASSTLRLPSLIRMELTEAESEGARDSCG